MTAGHCCLGNRRNGIAVTLSAYNLEAYPPEEDVLEYRVDDAKIPEELVEYDMVGGASEAQIWDVCILDLPESTRIRPVPIGEPFADACLSTAVITF